MKAFNVYLDDKCIDTIFYADTATETVDDVRRSLVNHDGYPSDIVVKRQRKERAK